MARKKKKNTDKRISKETFDKIKLPALITAIFMLFFSFFGVMLLGLGVVKIAQREDPYEAANSYSRVEFYSKNFLTLWLTGDQSNVPQMREMYSGVIPEVGTDPVQVNDLNVADAKMTKIPETEDRQWSVIVGSSVSALGASDTQRMFFRVTLRQHGDGLKAEKLPEPINNVKESFEVKPSFQGAVGKKSSAFIVVQNFVQEYYTQNDSGSLGRYVTNDFSSAGSTKPVSPTVYTSSEVHSVQSKSMADNPDNVKAGERMQVLVTMKLSSTSSTFVYSQAVMDLQKTENGQWLVAGITGDVPPGAVTEK